MKRRARDAGSGGRPGVSARTTALRLLGRRDYTAAEVNARLLARGYPDEAVSATVDQLRDEGLIDDLRAARAHVRTAGIVKGRGRLRIRYELEARGVSRDTADRAAREWTPHDEREVVARLVTRRTGGRTPTPADRRRLIQQLRRRGFPLDMILSVLSGHPPDDPAPDSDD